MASRDSSSPADRRKNPARNKTDRRKPGADTNETIDPDRSPRADVRRSDNGGKQGGDD
jgi:hypothetical protein